jgi:hypothetical protein
MSKRTLKSPRHAIRTPWETAILEVPSAWLEDEAKSSSSPYSLLASWKGNRGGVPSHVMLKLLRRRLSEYHSELLRTALPPAELQRAQDTLKQIWERVGRAGGKHPTWLLVDGLLRVASAQMRAGRVEPDHRDPDRPGSTRSTQSAFVPVVQESSLQGKATCAS